MVHLAKVSAGQSARTQLIRLEQDVSSASRRVVASNSKLQRDGDHARRFNGRLSCLFAGRYLAVLQAARAHSWVVARGSRCAITTQVVIAKKDLKEGST